MEKQIKVNATLDLESLHIDFKAGSYYGTQAQVRGNLNINSTTKTGIFASFDLSPEATKILFDECKEKFEEVVRKKND